MKLFKKHADAHRKANASLVLTKEGNGRYELDDDLLPKKPQTPAQHSSVKKAAKVSAMRRKLAAGKGFGGF